MKNKRFSAIILAAGLGSRMGYLKPLLKIGNNTLILYLTSLFLSAGADTVFIVLGHRGTEIEAAFNGVDRDIAEHVRFVYNSAYMEDMFISVTKGVAAALDYYCGNNFLGTFVIPADYPLLKTKTAAMLARAASESDNRVIYPVKDGQRGHPPFIPMNILKQIFGWAQEGGLRAFLELFPSVDMETEDAGILEDMDTPETYAAILEKRGLRTYPTPPEALRLLEDLNTDIRIIRHGQAVGKLAKRIAELLSDYGHPIDIELAHSAGILHDLCKGANNHALAGFELLMARAFPGAARVVRVHMDIDEKSLGTLCPESIVYLADKMTLDCRYVTLAERREHTRHKLLTRLPNIEAGLIKAPDAAVPGLRRMDNADMIYRTVCDICGLEPDELMSKLISKL